MTDDLKHERRAFGWALPVSLVLHVLIAALLIFDLPISLPQPQEEAIAAELVPPPEPAEKAKAAPPPPPSPEKPQEAKPPPPAAEAERREAMRTLQPVVRYGETDAGPRKSLDGNSAEDGAGQPAPDPEEQATPEKPAEMPVEAPEQTSQPEPPKAESAAAANTDSAENGSAPLDILRDANIASDPAQQTVAPAAESDNEVPLPEAVELPKPRPANTSKPQSAPKLREAGKLFSEQANGGPIATSAMGGLPREVRVAKLCASELRQQLLRTSPPYFSEMIPEQRLKTGTVLELSETAFRAGGQWYNLSFRCTVDTDATRVESFAFRVGDPIPRSEWASRRPPLE